MQIPRKITELIGQYLAGISKALNIIVYDIVQK